MRVPIGLLVAHFDLPLTSFPVDQLASDDSGYIEAVIHGDLTEIHHPNGVLDSTAAGQSFDQVIGKISRSVPYQGRNPPFLISATASTKFNTIRSVVRSAAATGIYRILFLVKSDTEGSGVIRMDLPTAGEPIPEIDPFFIQIDATDRIYTGTGPNRTRMDNDPDDSNLEKLNSQLELFSAAAKSWGCEAAPCQIYVSPEASYQRMIEVIAAIRKWDLSPYFTDLEPEPRPLLERIQRKPTPPGSSREKIRPLGLAPK